MLEEPRRLVRQHQVVPGRFGFEALRELRRVAGTQLDGEYVEVLAQLLSGEGVDYRHADAADFDTELAMERRIKEAGAG